MKRSWPLLLVSLLLAVSVAVQAQDYTWTTNADDTIAITGAPYYLAGDVTIPATITGLTVTRIGDYAFQNSFYLTSVMIPGSISNIGDYIFNNCANLTNADLGEGTTSIGVGEFYQCPSLTNLTIPDSVTSIGDYAFNGTGLAAFSIGANVTSIGENPFGRCTSLKEITVDSDNVFYGGLNGVLFDKGLTTLIGYPGGMGGSYTIPGSVRSIGDYAFYFCINLTGVTIPGSVTNIGQDAFNYCSSLASVTIPASVTSIPSEVFKDCVSLANVTIADSVISIGNSAFEDCRALGSVTIPASVTSIGFGAFWTCPSLTKVTILGNLTNIGGYAFYLCSLTTVTFYGNVTSIGDDAFCACYGLTSVYFTGNAPSADSTAFNSDHIATVYYLPGTTGWASTFGGIPAEEVPPYSFTINADETVTINGYTGPGGSVAIPATIIGLPVSSIAEHAFENLTSVTNATIPGSVTYIGDGAFASCRSLTSVYFESNAPTVGSSVFFGDSVTVYYLPGFTGWSSTLGGITAEVLQYPYSFSINADETISILGYTGSGGTVTIPATIIGLPVTSIGENAFWDCALTSVEIPGSVTSIGENAFALCGDLTNATIADGVVSIGEGAFIECGSLASVTIPASVTSIGDYAFEATSVISVYFKGNAPTVGSLVFNGINSGNAYYLLGTTGWGGFSEKTGLPAVLWSPMIQTGDGRFGVQNNQFGFSITNTGFTGSFPSPFGTYNPSVVVEVCTNLVNPVWTRLQTLTVSNGSCYFNEPFQPNSSGRFYGLGLP